jgi:hypothetical protein
VHDVAPRHPAEVARLREILWAWMLRDPGMQEHGGFVVPRGDVPRTLFWIQIDGTAADASTTRALDELARKGVRFTQAYAASTEPSSGLLATLGGARPSELAAASKQGLLPHVLGVDGLRTHAIAARWEQLGFASGEARGDRTPAQLAADATAWLAGHGAERDRRVFLFVDASAPDGAAAPILSAALEAAAADKTVVVVSAARGRAIDSPVPLVLVAPGILPAGATVDARVRAADLAPTLEELFDLPPQPQTSGRSLLPLAFGGKEPDPRAVVVEGEGTRALLHGPHLLVERGARFELGRRRRAPRTSRRGALEHRRRGQHDAGGASLARAAALRRRRTRAADLRHVDRR